MYSRTQHTSYNSHICYVNPLRDTEKPAIQIFNVTMWKPFLRLTQQLKNVWPSTIRVIADTGDDTRRCEEQISQLIIKKIKLKATVERYDQHELCPLPLTR